MTSHKVFQGAGYDRKAIDFFVTIGQPIGMKVAQEIKLTLAGKVCYVNFSVIFGKDYGAWDYDWIVNKVTSDNQPINFHFMDNKYKAVIENAIETCLYRFPFEYYDDAL